MRQRILRLTWKERFLCVRLFCVTEIASVYFCSTMATISRGMPEDLRSRTTLLPTSCCATRLKNTNSAVPAPMKQIRYLKSSIDNYRAAAWARRRPWRAAAWAWRGRGRQWYLLSSPSSPPFHPMRNVSQFRNPFLPNARLPRYSLLCLRMWMRPGGCRYGRPSPAKDHG